MTDIDHAAMTRAYAKWAPVYDMLCGPFFNSGRQAAAALARSLGRDILEIGVGTGLSFADYRPDNRITGIDASPEMIAKASERLRTGRHPQVEDLEVMDAHDLAFPDASFDVVVAQFVITLVQNPERVLDEAIRVLRPGGSIVLVNHFYSEAGPLAALERGASRAARQLGLRPDFPFARIEAWCRHRGAVHVARREKLAPFGWFTLVHLRLMDAGAGEGRVARISRP